MRGHQLSALGGGMPTLQNQRERLGAEGPVLWPGWPEVWMADGPLSRGTEAASGVLVRRVCGVWGSHRDGEVCWAQGPTLGGRATVERWCLGPNVVPTDHPLQPPVQLEAQPAAHLWEERLSLLQGLGPRH